MHKNAKILYNQLKQKCGTTVAEWFRLIVVRAERDEKFREWICYNVNVTTKLSLAFIWERGSATISDFHAHERDDYALLECSNVWKKANMQLIGETL